VNTRDAIVQFNDAEAHRDAQRVLLALCVWREARGESVDAKAAVATSIRNRVLKPAWWGVGWVGVLTKKWQYTSMTGDGDPNLQKWPQETDTSWVASLAIAYAAHSGQLEDRTQGATHYFDNSLDPRDGKPDRRPKWAKDGSMQHTVDVGAFHFFR